MFQLFAGLFDSNEKQLKKIQPIIDKINSYDEYVSKLSNEELKAKTLEFREKLQVNLEEARLDTKDFHEVKSVLDRSKIDSSQKKLLEILPEAFAVVREASHRVANHRHFDVQLTAGYFLFTNKVVELFTGEGKTLAANLPLYLYALTGKGAHLVTVNDYLAKRDAEWNGHILNSLGISVSAVNNDTQYRFVTDEEAIKIKGDEAKELIKQREELAKSAGRMKYDHMSGVNLIECSKKEAYACDVVYGTNNEFGFDYLRDNMSLNIADRVQGPLHYAIVDEADSILIDEARTPLIISQSAGESNDLYSKFANVVRALQPEVDYTVDEKAHSSVATDEGLKKVELALNVKNIYEDPALAYHLENALKAKALYQRDEEYIIREGEILIVDEFTGRVLQGRRYSEGLHQAIEAKEGVEVKKESRTLATITLQNYFRLYDYMAGMTGTALTESEEFAKIYSLEVIVVPTNRPMVRIDRPDVVYRSEEGKFRAIAKEIIERHEKGQPVLVGTTSVDKSERLSTFLSKEGVPHNVLNAKYHEKESKIVSQAGQKGAITIATNMAGRGTDISLGEGVKEVGGLYIIGSERHESRRIDNQLRGRSGRQGDPGESLFYVSFEDELMRIFGGDNMKMIMERVGMDDDMPIASSILGKTIEAAQKRVEARNYDVRKNLVEYDDVLNQQREIIYGIRRRILTIIKEQIEANSKNTNQQIQIRPEQFKDLDFNTVLDQMDAFSIRNIETYSIAELERFEDLNKPLNIFILKKVVDYVRYLTAAQLADDMQIDNTETRTYVKNILALLTEDLAEVAAKVLGYESSLDLFKEFDSEKNLAKKEDLIMKLVLTSFIIHTSSIGSGPMTELAKMLILQTIDQFWMQHLDTMADLREGISLRQMAQRDPLVEYKNEGFQLFDEMLGNVDSTITNRFFKVRIVREDKTHKQPVQEVKADATNLLDNHKDNRPGQVAGPRTIKNQEVKVGRNDPCPCGSGKKYKKCHGAGK
jgi:preprotein translocase subunit SecA